MHTNHMMRLLNLIKQEVVGCQGKIFSLVIEMPLSVHISVTIVSSITGGKKKLKKVNLGKSNLPL